MPFIRSPTLFYLTKVRETDCDIDFIRTLLPTISWKGLRAAANDLGLDANTIPEENHPSISQDEEFLQVLHKTLFDIHVMEGWSGRR